MIPKRRPVRSQKLRKSAEGESCVRCGANDGTVVLAHYTGIRQHAYGKGKGVKGHDFLAAELCADCHRYFDRPQHRKSLVFSEEFHHLIALTQERWIREGLIQIKGAK